MQEADCYVILFGPEQPTPPTEKNIAPAKWPFQEAMIARASDKPFTLIVHAGTELPETLRNVQSPARFDFWNAADFQSNAHHVVKHLVDFKRRVDLPPGHQPYRFLKVEVRIKIDRSLKTLHEDWYHEVTVAETRDHFHHALSTGTKEIAEGMREAVDAHTYELEAGVGAEWHSASLEPLDFNETEFEYLIRVSPPLRPGENFGYRRSFELPNRHPTTRAQLQALLAERALSSRSVTSIFNDRYYGESIDVVYDADSLLLAIHLPKKLMIRSYRALVVESNKAATPNTAEIERCNKSDFLRLNQDPTSPERIIELAVPRPLFNHSYYLLYELDS